MLFLISYRGYAMHPAPNLYRSAVALEFLHDFILVHDDIVDHARTRREGPAMHARFEQELADHPRARFSGSDLALIVGDMLYAVGLNLFLSVEEAPERKARALECLTKAAVYTACGELKELLDALEPPEQATPSGIARTCQWKTAYYSFVCPLVTGATLAGAPESDVNRLTKGALALGVAFQIRDDVLDLMDGHSTAGTDQEFSDLREGKVTLPLWYALRHSPRRDANRLAAVLNGGEESARELRAARDIILQSGGVEYARREIVRYAGEAKDRLEGLTMAETPRQMLWAYGRQLLAISRNGSGHTPAPAMEGAPACDAIP